MKLTTYDWWLIGRYGGTAVLAGVFWLMRQRWLPHHHDGYVSLGGYVHACGRCGRLPDGAYRTGFRGTIGPDGYDRDGYDKDGYDRDGLNRDGHDRDTLSRAFWAGYARRSHQDMDLCQADPLSPEWVTCPDCGRDDVAAHTMTNGRCARCTAIRAEDSQVRRLASQMPEIFGDSN